MLSGCEIGLLIGMYGVREKLRNALTSAWNLLQNPIAILAIAFFGSILIVIAELHNPVVFYPSVSLAVASISLIVAAKKVDRIRRRLRTIASGISAIYLAIISFNNYLYYRAFQPVIRVYTLLIGVVFLILGVMTLLSIKITRLEKVLRLSVENAS